MSHSPLLGLVVNPDSDLPIYEQVYNSLRSRMIDGRLLSGDCLPPTRKLAEELGVSRTTIVMAYNQLVAEGFANSRRGSGVYVSDIGTIEGIQVPEIRQTTSNGVTTNDSQKPFTPGIPDSRLFPYRQWAKCIARVARSNPEALVQMDDKFGDWQLRSQICRYLAEWRGVHASPEQVLITAGAIDALEICVRTLTEAGDILALEDPGYLPLREFVTALGIPAANLEMDQQGGIPPEQVRGTSNPKLVVLTPSSQFPLGGAMPQARRNAFLEWAALSNSWIIEDDYDSEFRYSGRPIPAMAGLDKFERTLYVGSFSKVFYNNLRMGFVVMPPSLIEKFSDTPHRFGSKASVMPQRPLAEFIEQGDYYRHIRRVRRIYADRRRAFLELLQTHLGTLVTFEDHRAGMQIAIRLPYSLKDTVISKEASKTGIHCPALSTYYSTLPPQNGLLMGFCGYTFQEMDNAMEKLKKIIQSEQDK